MSSRRVLLTGSTGYLGRWLLAELVRRAVPHVTLGRNGCDLVADLADAASVRAAVLRAAPTHVLHAGAIAAMAACERDEARALAVNALSVPALLAHPGARMLLVSTDLVFDGEAAPYAEAAEARPLSAYGRSKLAAERLLRAGGRGLVVRTPLLFGRSHDGTKGATDMIRKALADHAHLVLFTDEWRTPLHVADAARALVDELLGDRVGVLHLAGPERVSRAAFGLRFCELTGLDASRIATGARNDPRRPRDTSLVGSFRAARSLDAMLQDA